MTYVGLVDLLHKFRYAIARNDFDLRLAVWKEMLTFCFVFNNVYYARYGTCYVTILGQKNKIEEYGLSVCRNDLGMRQAKLAGKQTFMKFAKTAAAGSYFFFFF